MSPVTLDDDHLSLSRPKLRLNYFVRSSLLVVVVVVVVVVVAVALAVEVSVSKLIALVMSN